MKRRVGEDDHEAVEGHIQGLSLEEAEEMLPLDTGGRREPEGPLPKEDHPANTISNRLARGEGSLLQAEEGDVADKLQTVNIGHSPGIGFQVSQALEEIIVGVEGRRRGRTLCEKRKEKNGQEIRQLHDPPPLWATGVEAPTRARASTLGGSASEAGSRRPARPSRLYTRQIRR
jgi:hypothetical protein